MSWSFSFELLPGEEVVEDSTKRNNEVIKSAYSVFLTDRRVIFRFDGMGSYLSNAFFYDDVLDVRATKRIFVTYLILKTKRKEYLFNISEPEYWIRQIVASREKYKGAASAVADMESVPQDKKKRLLLDMITVLHRNRILTEEEFEAKVHLLDTMK